MAKEWLECFEELEVPHTQEPNLIGTLGDPVKIRSWQVRVAPLICWPQSVASHLLPLPFRTCGRSNAVN